MNNSLNFIFYFLCLLFIAALVSGCFLLSQLRNEVTGRQTSVITELSNYDEVIDSYSGSDALKHFPSKFPELASNIEFFFLPGFLQGATIIQLKIEVPEAEFDQFTELYRQEALHIFQSGTDDPPIPQPTMGTQTGERSNFPDSFELIVLGANATGQGSFEWNHGTTYGVALDGNQSVVIYWAQDW